MKKKIKKFSFAALAVATFAFTITSCAKKAEKQEELENDSIVVVEEIPETKDYSVYSFDQKNDVITDAKAELNAINKKIEELKAELAQKQQELSADTKTAYDNAIKELEKTRDQYKAKVDALEQSTEETWEAAKAEVSNAYNAAAQGVEDTYNNAKSVVSDAVSDAKDAVSDAKDAVSSGIDSVQKKLLQ